MRPAVVAAVAAAAAARGVDRVRVGVDEARADLLGCGALADDPGDVVHAPHPLLNGLLDGGAKAKPDLRVRDDDPLTADRYVPDRLARLNRQRQPEHRWVRS